MKIILYTKVGCSKCLLVKRYLISKGLHFTEINIDVHEEATKQLLARGFTTLPVLNINSKWAQYTTLEGLKNELL
jgi:glutaredoxin